MSVLWTTNANGAHEVSSNAHLLQIMSRGALGVDTGTVPVDYWEVSYVQTVDIDLADHANIVPIGDYSTKFTGGYDGGLFHIKNIVYTGSAVATGLFGYAEGATLTQIRLSGIWVTTGGQKAAGLLCGYMSACTVTDVEGSFAEGTVINGTPESVTGCLIGHVSGGSLTGIRIGGSLDVLGEPGAGGGLIGKVSGGATVSQCENTASFATLSTIEFQPSGSIGEMHGSTLTACLNGMVGEHAVYDVAEADDEAFQAVGGVFQTGDDVSITLDRKKTNTTFVNTGEELSVIGVDNVFIPSAAQDVLLKLSDESSVSLSLDDSGAVDVGGVTYSIGEYFILHNKKVTVVDV